MMDNLKRKISYKCDMYFIALCLLLIPAIYFMICGSEWEVWGIIPDEYQQALIDGDATLYSISLSYICSFIIYIFVNYLPDRKKIEDETYSFMREVQQYMFSVEHAIFMDMDQPEIFCSKLYNKPMYPKKLYKAEKWKDILQIFNMNFVDIDGYYSAYRSHKKKMTLSKEEMEYMNECEKKLKALGEEYRTCANKMTIEKILEDR